MMRILLCWLSIVFLVAIGFFTFQRTNNVAIKHDLRTLAALELVEALVTRAETGQRGFILTRDEQYRTDYDMALEKFPPALKDLKSLTSKETVLDTEILIQAKFDELAETLRLEATPSLQLIKSNKGLMQMALIRSNINSIRTQTKAHLNEQQDRLSDMVRIGFFFVIFPIAIFSTPIFAKRIK